MVIPTGRLLPRVRRVQPCCADIQVFIQGFSNIAAPLTLMLRTSSSTDSSTSAAQIVVEYNGVDDSGGGGKLVEKLSKVKKPQRPEKSIGSEEPGFLTTDTRLAFTKMGPNRTKLTMENYWPACL